ncbi:MAG: hypothetical protein KGI73_01235 [Patescibacteria group bacterium]|nr:hypothetical protein [Patescibacteria group bacterium]
MKTNTKTKKGSDAAEAESAAPRGYPVYRPTVSKILVCTCGVKYIKTRARQTTCIKCMVRAEDAKLKR